MEYSKSLIMSPSCSNKTAVLDKGGSKEEVVVVTGGANGVAAIFLSRAAFKIGMAGVASNPKKPGVVDVVLLSAHNNGFESKSK